MGRNSAVGEKICAAVRKHTNIAVCCRGCAPSQSHSIQVIVRFALDRWPGGSGFCSAGQVRRSQSQRRRRCGRRRRAETTAELHAGPARHTCTRCRPSLGKSAVVAMSPASRASTRSPSPAVHTYVLRPQAVLGSISARAPSHDGCRTLFLPFQPNRATAITKQPTNHDQLQPTGPLKLNQPIALPATTH